MPAFVKSRNVVHACYYHIVWCPKWRKSVLIDDVARRLQEIICDECESRNVSIQALEIMPDHVHLLCAVDPRLPIPSLVKSLKGASSRVLRQEFQHLVSTMPCLWTHSYFVSTTGGAPLEKVKAYVETQQTRPSTLKDRKAKK